MVDYFLIVRRKNKGGLKVPIDLLHQLENLSAGRFIQIGRWFVG